MKIKKIIFASIIISMMFTVFFSSQKVDAVGQWIRATDATGNTKFGFWDYIPPECTIPDTVYAGGMGFTPNSQMNLYLSWYPENRNVDGRFEIDPEDPPTLNLAFFVPHLGPPTAVQVDGNGNIPVTALVNVLTSGEYNVISNAWTISVPFYLPTDAIDIIDLSGVIVGNCENSQLKMGISVISQEALGSILSFGDFNGDGYNDLVVGIPNAGAVQGVSTTSLSDTNNVSIGPAVYVMYSDNGQLYAGVDHKILQP